MEEKERNEQMEREKHEQIISQRFNDLSDRSTKYFAGLRYGIPFCGNRVFFFEEMHLTHMKSMNTENCHNMVQEDYGNHIFRRLLILILKYVFVHWKCVVMIVESNNIQLWKYQLEHRQVLERKCSLKRHEIGEIASKIAQLYYHYYLRTSDTRYLQESFVFYDAIKTRKYFADIKRENTTLFNKKLRYYARFIVVCLLQNKRNLVEELLRDLNEILNDLQSPSPLPNNIDNEWQLVVSELESFMKAERSIVIGENIDHLSYRYRTSCSTSSQYENPIVLSEALLIGHRKKHVKFSELTLDVLRMMQAIEYCSPDSKKQVSTTPRLKNPHKSILYRPGYCEVMSLLANSLSEVEYSDNAILLYFSVDGYKDGLALNPKKRSSPILSSATPSPSSATPLLQGEYQFCDFADVNCLTLDDILPFTRKPFFIIADSDNSTCMRPSQCRFNIPFMSLMSPRTNIPQLRDPMKNGSIFTHFLTSPLTAYAVAYGFNKMDNDIFEHLSEHLEHQYLKLLNILFASEQLHSFIKIFLGNEFLQRFILNYMFCRVTIYRLYTKNQINGGVENNINLGDYLPCAFPEVPCMENPNSKEYQVLVSTCDYIFEKLSE